MKLGLALPKWLVDKDNNILVLFVYALAFGIGLPFMVVRTFFYCYYSASPTVCRGQTLKTKPKLTHIALGPIRLDGGTLPKKSTTLKF